MRYLQVVHPFRDFGLLVLVSRGRCSRAKLITSALVLLMSGYCESDFLVVAHHAICDVSWLGVLDNIQSGRGSVG